MKKDIGMFFTEEIFDISNYKHIKIYIYTCKLCGESFRLEHPSFSFNDKHSVMRNHLFDHLIFDKLQKDLIEHGGEG